MAVVAVTHNITRQEDFEGTPGGTVGSTGGGPAAAATAGLHYEALQSLSRRINATTGHGFDYAHGDIGTVDMYAADFLIYLFKGWTVLGAALDPPGQLTGIGDADGSVYTYQTGDDGTMGDDADFEYPVSGGYVFYPIEGRVNAWHTIGREATPDISLQVLVEVIWDVNATTGAGISSSLDAIDYTEDGLFMVGGDSSDPDATFADFVAADQGAGVAGAARAGLWREVPAGIQVFLNNVIGRTDAGVATATVMTDSGFNVKFPGGLVSEGRNGLEFDITLSSQVYNLTDGTIAGSARRFGGRSKIKRYFDTALDVNAGTDRITILGHGFQTGDAVIYSAEGGSDDIGPDATNGEAEFNTAGAIGTGPYWYVSRFDDDEIALHATPFDAYSTSPTNEALTVASAPGENHSLTRAPDTRPNILFVGTAGTANFTRITLPATRIITMTSPVVWTACVIPNGRQIILNDATLEACICVGMTTGIGEAYLEAINANDLDRLDNSSFTSGGLGHFAEVTTDGITAEDIAALDNVALSGYFGGDSDNTGGVGFDPDDTAGGGDIDLSTEQINITTHPFSDGDPVYYSDEGGTVPTATPAVVDQGLYYVNSVDANNITLHLTRSAAVAGSSAIDFTNGSTDTLHKLYSANAALFNNTGTLLTINVLNGGTAPTVRNSAGSTVVVNNAVTVKAVGMTEGAAVKYIADETVGSLTKGDLLSEGLVESDGEFEFSLNYEGAFDPSGLDVLLIAAQNGLPNAAVADDGAVLTNETTAANSTTDDDMTLTPDNPQDVNDAYYLGHAEQFIVGPNGRIRFKLEVSQIHGAGNPTIVWEFFSGTWDALTFTDADPNPNFTTLGEHIYEFDAEAGWVTTTINGQGPFYYVRARVSVAGTSTNGARGRFSTLDVLKYFRQDLKRTIPSAGRTDTVPWNLNTIALFDPAND